MYHVPYTTKDVASEEEVTCRLRETATTYAINVVVMKSPPTKKIVFGGESVA